MASARMFPCQTWYINLTHEFWVQLQLASFQSALYLSKWYRRPSELFDVPDDWLFAKDFHLRHNFPKPGTDNERARCLLFREKWLLRIDISRAMPCCLLPKPRPWNYPNRFPTGHPAAVYLGFKSRVAAHHAFPQRDRLSADRWECDCFTLDWSKLRYRHTAGVRTALKQRPAATTVNKMLVACGGY